jgi:hypothetical protein
MKVVRGYKTELDLNHKQITDCKKHAGAARYAYNWLRHEVACVAVETAQGRTQPGVLPPVLY